LPAAGAFVCLETELEELMNRESEQYRFARVEAYHTTLANLEKQFSVRAVSLEEMETAVAEQLAKERLCVPWRKSEDERAACRDGMRLAALQFLSQYQEALELLGMQRSGRAPQPMGQA
jgi:hypothetical protein